LEYENLSVIDTVRIFVVGTGRSGTSLAAGLFRQHSIFMGDSLLRPSEANPYGYFEDKEVNAINEALIAPFIPARQSDHSGHYCQDIPSESQRWLARLPLSESIVSNDAINKRIMMLYSRKNSCFKDPRFCYTLDAWRNLLGKEQITNAIFLCVFRHPAVVAESLLKEMRTAQYLRNLAISVDQIYAYWNLSYQHILQKHSQHGKWLYVSYESMFTEKGLSRIEKFCGFNVDRSLPEKNLSRSQAIHHVDPNCLKIYKKLQQLEAEEND
jgi:hypothetical protein